MWMVIVGLWRRVYRCQFTASENQDPQERGVRHPWEAREEV